MASPIISKYAGFEVEVLYLTDNNAYRDRGRLTECDSEWLVLHKPSAEEFLIPMTAIRIVKVIAPPKEEETTLLRPALPQIEESEESLTGKTR